MSLHQTVVNIAPAAADELPGRAPECRKKRGDECPTKRQQAPGLTLSLPRQAGYAVSVVFGKKQQTVALSTTDLVLEPGTLMP